MTPQTEQPDPIPQKIVSGGEHAFRSEWAATRNLPRDVRMRHLLSSLEGWLAGVLAVKNGIIHPFHGGLAALSQLEQGAYEDMQQHVHDAVRDDWNIEHLISAITATGLADAGIEL